jgi:hypothetical protein
MNSLTADLPLFVRIERDAALAQVEANAGPCFKARALRFVVEYLREHGERSGEEITDAAKAAGITPENTDRAFGPVYASLLKDGLIQRVGFCLRKKGHGCSGGSVYRLSK